MKNITKISAMIMAAVMATSLFVAAPARHTYADEIVREGETLNQNEGTVTTNEGTVTTNNSQINNNYGEVGTNTDNAEITNNFSGGVVGQNDGNIFYNREGATVSENKGTVGVNSGQVTNVDDPSTESIEGTVQLNDGGTVNGNGIVIVNLGGTVNGTAEIGYNLGNGNVATTVNIRNQMWEIIPKTVDDWKKIRVSGDNMHEQKYATINTARDAESFKMNDVDGSIMSVWVSETKDGTIYLTPTGNTRDIKDLATTGNAVITKLEDGRWCISNVTGNVVLTYILEVKPTPDQKDDDNGNEEFRIISAVKQVAEWTLSEDNNMLLAGQVKTSELSDPAIKSALYDFLINSLAGTFDVSKAKVINSLTVSLKEPKVIKVPAGISGLTPESNVYVSCTDLETGEMRYVKAVVEADGTINFAVPFRKCAFSIVIFD